MTNASEERGANREKIKRIVILIVTGLIAAAGGYQQGKSGSVPGEIKLVLDKPLQCVLVDKIGVDVTGKLGLEVVEKVVKK